MNRTGQKALAAPGQAMHCVMGHAEVKEELMQPFPISDIRLVTQVQRSAFLQLLPWEMLLRWAHPGPQALRLSEQLQLALVLPLPCPFPSLPWVEVSPPLPSPPQWTHPHHRHHRHHLHLHHHLPRRPHLGPLQAAPMQQSDHRCTQPPTHWSRGAQNKRLGLDKANAEPSVLPPLVAIR